MTPTHDAYALLRHTSWIQELARTLVADPNTADDLVQDAWVTALEHRPASGGPMRGWFATVLRNHLSKLRSRDTHRVEREHEVSRGERTLSTLDIVEKAESHRDVVETVLALDEPYRSTILMRFFEQLSYGEIATRTGVAVATVNSRLTRGLAELRSRLERRYASEDRNGLAVLTTLATTPQGVAAATAGGTLVMTPLHISLVSTATALAAVSFWHFSGASSSGPEPVGGVATLAASHTEPDFPWTAVPPAAAQRGLVEPTFGETGPTGAALGEEFRLAAEQDEPWVVELSHDHTLGADIRSIHLDTPAGSIEVREGAPGMVSIDATIEADRERVAPERLTTNFADHVNVEEDGAKLVIEDAYPDDGDNDGLSVSLVVLVPRGLALSANSGAGEVTLHTAAGDVNANSGAGSVKLLAPQHTPQNVQLNSGAGDVVIEVASVQGELRANAGAGGVQATLHRSSPSGELSLSSGAGSIHLAVPSNVSGELEVQTGVGDITLPPSFGIDVEETDGVGGRASGRVGSGGPKLRLQSGAGSITIELTGTRAKPL